MHAGYVELEITTEQVGGNKFYLIASELWHNVQKQRSSTHAC